MITDYLLQQNRKCSDKRHDQFWLEKLQYLITLFQALIAMCIILPSMLHGFNF